LTHLDYKIKFKLAAAAGLLLVTGATQFSYFTGASLPLIVLSGIIIGLFAVIHANIKLKFIEVILVCTFAFMVLLSFALIILGEEGYLKSRPIYFFSVAQLFAAIIAIKLTKSTEGRKYLLNIFLALLVLEALIVFGQFSYITFGIGFEVEPNLLQPFQLVTGSFANPNNSAAFIGLLCFVLSLFLLKNGMTAKALLLLIFVLPAIFVTLSRTMLVFWFLNLVCLLWVVYTSRHAQLKFTKFYFSIFFLFAVLILYLVFNFLLRVESDVIERSLIRVNELSSLGDDTSIDFRFISHLRLIENFFNLGLGSFTDLSYFKFFQSSDPWLMKVNPHSYIVEYSFLFGFFGFLLIASIFFCLIWLIFKNRDVPLVYKISAIFGLLFIQAVPSSLLTSVYFFIPFVMMAVVQFRSVHVKPQPICWR